MRLFQSAILAGSTSALQRGLDPAQSIAFAHSRVRQGFLIKEMDKIIDENERLLREVFEPDFSQRLISLDEMVSRSENITQSFRNQGNCDSSFPTYDGSCNHPENKGRSMGKYERLVPADYCDGKQQPRCAKSGGRLPDERKISLQMGKNRNQNKDNIATSLFTAWGQFLTHDIIQTPDVGKGSVPCDCEPNNSCVNIRLQNDPKLRFRCMFIIRSSGVLSNQGGKPSREQLNQQTSFIDGSVVYGFNQEHKNQLTHSNKRHLMMDSNNKFGDFLPNVNNKKFGNGIKNSFETADVFNDKGHPEFVAGDTRVLENPVLSSYHTLFARLHNLAVDAFTEE